MDDLRVVFMGSASLSRTSLEALLKAPGLTVVAAVTQPDKPRGRGNQVLPTEVKQLAGQAGIPVLQPLKARDAGFVSQLQALAPDLIVVVAYGQILPQAILDLPRLGCLNVHTSLLPKYRGAAPIQRAILDGETETGVTIMKIGIGLDTGDILTTRTTPILEDDDAARLHDRLAVMGAELLVETIPAHASGAIIPKPQPPEGTYAAKLKKEEGHIDWTRPAREILNRIRAFSPWPGSFTRLDSGGGPMMLKIWKARLDSSSRSGQPGTILQADKAGIVVATGDGALVIEEIQPESGKRMPVAAFLAGHPLPTGARFSA
jgi:methionyl-tRNA formyltransferase